MKSLSFSLAAVLFFALFTAAARHGGHPSSTLAAVSGGSFPAASSTAQVSEPVRAVPTPHRNHLRRATPSLDWDKLAECESSGNWQDTAGYYQGGLQFSPRTWESFHGTDYAPRADLATRWQQITIAERVLRRQGLAAWPACTKALGWR